MKAVGAVLAVILAVIALTMVVIPQVNDLGHTDGPEVRETWQYDDYRPVPGDIVSAIGALEIVDVGGTSYIHAKAVGDGTLVRSDWSMETVTVSRAVIDLIYIDGQSNAAQNTQDLTTAPVPLPGTAYYFGSEERYAVAGRISSQEDLDNAITEQLDTWSFQSMVDGSGAVKIGDKAPGIAKAYYERTGHRVYIVDGAVPGSPVRYHIPESTSDVTNWSWQWAVLVIEKALDSVDPTLYDLNLTGIDLWLQGESDARFSSAAYIKYWRQYHTGAVGGLLGIPVTNIVICLIANVTDESGTVNAALVELAETYEDVTIGASAAGFSVEGGELNPEDSLHYTQEGDNIVGREWGESAAKITNGKNPDTGGSTTPEKKILNLLPVLIVGCIVIFLGSVAVRKG